MEEHSIKRAATRLIQKYGKKALPKAVEVARYYLEEGDEDNAKRWVSIGYAVKKALKIQTVREIEEQLKEDEALEV